jgi:plastocyanin
MNFRTLALASALVLPAAALADHTYQVTGPVVSSSPDSITVKKGSENWEIARGDDKTEVKAGDKVTITYTMTAKKVEMKSGGDTKKAKKSAK